MLELRQGLETLPGSEVTCFEVLLLSRDLDLVLNRNYQYLMNRSAFLYFIKTCKYLITRSVLI
jgi:hypothetical protein